MNVIKSFCIVTINCSESCVFHLHDRILFTAPKSLFSEDIIWKQQNDWSLSIFTNEPFEAGDNKIMV